MKLISSLLAAASLSTAALVAVPAAAQVQGNIATVNAPAVVINSNAFTTAYQQIATTYKPQLDTIQARQQESQTLLQQLDTNKDNQLDEAEQQAAQNSPQATRLQAIEQEVAQLTDQVEAARVYAIEQILAQYRPALEEVVQQLRIQVVLTPDVVVYAPQQANITQQVTAAVNAKVPSVAIVPPQNWRPTRNAVAIYQQIQQTLMAAQAIQAQQQAAQQPNPQAPSGR
ncbi:OmpH family outer membrane protein [Altererythrobacter litoralis]|uniref:OmpH family outer membrane protein n=1 Tax=Altererythrobacter litoralis TaxID=3113904 RepID=A0ABU7GFG1_9SPHN|nr:OmpH family outer membrane protein [Erythrobacteraceae bacterium 1XM1-14]